MPFNTFDKISVRNTETPGRVELTVDDVMFGWVDDAGLSLARLNSGGPGVFKGLPLDEQGRVKINLA